MGEKARDILELLTEDEFIQNLGDVLGSVKEKVTHIIFALLTCCSILEIKVKYMENTFEKTVQTISSYSKKDLIVCWKELDEILTNTLDGDLSGTVTIQRRDGDSFCLKRDDFILQYILHTVYHRGQLNYCLKALNKQRIDGDYLFYFDEIDTMLESSL